MKKFLIIIFIVLVLPTVTLADGNANMVIEHVPTTVAQQQEFYVDVVLDPQGKDFNGVEGTVSFSGDTLSFVRAETGTSVLSYFVDRPTAVTDTINFSGIIVGGFSGVINPFDPGHKLPGTVVRLVFAGKAPGSAIITTSYIKATDNDGIGTLENIPGSTAVLTVSNDVAKSTYTTPDTTPPTITASVTSDPNLFNSKFALIFNAIDKESGIDHVTLQEGNSAWTTIESPYLLRDQSRQSILTVRAYDVAGNIATVTVPPAAASGSPVARTIVFILVIIAILVLVYVIYKKHVHKKIPL